MSSWFNIYQHRRLYWSLCIFCPLVVAKRLNCALSLFWTWQRLSLSGWMFWLEGRGTLSIFIQWGQKMHKHNRPQWNKHNRPQWKYRYAESKGENTWKHHVICNYSVTRGISSVLWNLKLSIDVSWTIPNQSQHPWLPTDINPDSTWSFASQLRSAQFSRRIVAWRCVFFYFKVQWSTTPANPCNMSNMFGAKTQAIASIWAKMFHCTKYIIRSWSPGYYIYISTHSGATASRAAWCCASCRNCSRSISWWRRSCSACSCSRGKCSMNMKTS